MTDEEFNQYHYRTTNYTTVQTKWNKFMTVLSWMVCVFSMFVAKIHWLIPLLYFFIASVVFPVTYLMVRFILQDDCINRAGLVESGWSDFFVLKFTDRSAMTYEDYSKEVILDSNFWNAIISFFISLAFLISSVDKINF